MEDINIMIRRCVMCDYKKKMERIYKISYRYWFSLLVMISFLTIAKYSIYIDNLKYLLCIPLSIICRDFADWLAPKDQTSKYFWWGVFIALYFTLCLCFFIFEL